MIRWALISVFESLKGASGAGRTVRRLLAVPITGLLSRQRKARGGHRESRIDLFVIDVAAGVAVSGVLQGFLVTLAPAIAFVVIGFLVF
ncbi:hypothetical protein VSH64_36250 [Amycolatopsis rhabdoformis]|uniref:Uncharacterized protein n=1 Tax=Amycolatopsis rhabdoformis TaxID=1448059 RepID=A0ABZ1I1I7_9PSEU|nr:hypothetical protein [Amycolatopsis rhabdoformis]WSE28252.1 hypothetical protein VSH64_36250 [Amycolatopsis rhabdoformis]